MRRFQLLCLCVFVWLFASLAYSQANPPSADTMTYSSLPTKNYGSYTSLLVQVGAVTSNSYIQFNLSSLPTGAVVTKATLRLYVNQVNTAGSFDVYQLDNSWSESTLNYNNAPPLGTSATGGNPVAFTTTTLNQFVLIDITSLVQGWVSGSIVNDGVALSLTTSAGAIAFDSKEATLTSHQPELEIALASTGGGSGVTSWNSRTGAVVPQSGDYSFSLLSGALMDGQLAGTYTSPLTLSNASNILDGIFSGNGAGLTNVPVSAGSPNYIQNGTTQQTGASFNIDGSGTVGGTLTGTTAMNTSGTYQIGSSTILTGSSSNLSLAVGFSAAPNNTATQNTFVGVNAGLSTTTASSTTVVGYEAAPVSNGGSSVFVGSLAGEILNTGSENTMVGSEAGDALVNGSQNTFIGTLAGEGEGPARTGANVGNTYIGYAAGSDIEQGSYNVFIGYQTGIDVMNTAATNSNIYISNLQLHNTDSNTIRIGTDGTGNGQQNRAFMAGIKEQTITTGNPVWIDSTGMLGIGSSSNSGVTSFNGRTGAVVPASGDYSFSLLSGTLTDAQLSGTYMSNVLNFANSGNSFTGTSFTGGTFSGNGAGLTNVPVSAGSPNYIQNGTGQQTGASFNIDGSGTVGGTVTAATAFNTSGTYQFNGNPVLSTGGTTSNIYLGTGAGSNETGGQNVMIGTDAGQFGTGGDEVIIGYGAAIASGYTGAHDTLVGFRAGHVLTATTGGNTFVGAYAGLETTTAANDVLIGENAGDNGNIGNSDIYIANTGPGNAESNVIRIGTQGTGAAQQNVTYIAGINSNTVSSGSPVFVDSNGMLGLGASGNSGVTSFNTRTGAVVPASGDYSFSLLSGTLGSSQLSGGYSSAVTLSNASNGFTGNGAGLTNVPVSAGSTNYVQNGTTQQTGASFNIDGNGTVGGTLTATAAVNTGGTYNIGGHPALLATSGTAQNTFVGLGAGSGLTTGTVNTSVGFNAGTSVNSGGANAFFGTDAGLNLTTGSSNTFLGFDAGRSATTGTGDIYINNNGVAGEGNTIRIGTSSFQNTTYIAGIISQNISTGNPVWIDANGMLGIGSSSNSGVTSFNGRTGAVVPASGDYSFSLLSGALADAQLSGTYMSNVLTFANSGNSYLGTSFIGGAFSGNGAGLTNVPVSAGSANYIQNGTGQQTGASFNIDGSGTVGGTLTGTTAVNTNGTYQIGGTTVLQSTLGSLLNTFVGLYAGSNNTSGQQNTFVGISAGLDNTTGSDNTYVGRDAGGTGTSGNNNSFFGDDAGENLTTGSGNTFLGNQAGVNSSTNSYDIYINNGGVGGESHTIRIGTDGTGSGQQNIAYMAGIKEQTISTGNPVWIDSNGMLGIGSSSSGGVTSFNGRTGAVVPASGDYSFSLLSGTLGSSQLSGTYSTAVSLSNASNSFTGNGAGLTNVNAATLQGFAALGFVLNTALEQAGTTNFNISGNGTLGGTLSAFTAVNSGGTYQLGGSTILSASSDKLSVGLGAGSVSNGATNTFIGYNAGNPNTGAGNTYVGGKAGANSTSSNNDTFLGASAGNANISTSNDTMVGTSAGAHNTSGNGDTVIGSAADLSTGNNNTIIGSGAGSSSSSGSNNTIMGSGTAVALTSGDTSTLIGYAAGPAITTGSRNVLLGFGAGGNIVAGSSNVYVASSGSGDESNTIRIGTQGTNIGQQNKTYIAGITGATSAGGINVLVNSSGQLGTTTSSRRFKDNILDMGEASSKLFQLRPVTFFYKPEYDDGSHILQYGLIAEEVAKIYPDLVVYGEDGQPQTVRYHLLTPMLVNELQKQQKVLTTQQDVIATQQQQIQSQQDEIESLQQRLQRLESLVGKLAAVSASTHTMAAQ